MEFLGSSKSLAGLDIQFNPSGWGPAPGGKVATIDDMPYAGFDKKDKCNRVADFSMNPQNQNKQYQRYRRDGDHSANAEFSYKHDAVEDSSFQLVDTFKTQVKTRYGPREGKKTWTNTNANRNQQGGRGGGRGGDSSSAGGRGGRQQQGGRGGGHRQNYRKNDRKMERLPSLNVEGSWKIVEEFDLPQLLKLQANTPEAEDLVLCGHVNQYDETFDKVTTKTAKPLKRVDDKEFYSVTTTDDPVIERLAVDQVGSVFATDAILAQLMAAPRSIYSWDIVIQKMNGMVFFDKRENSNFDYLTVSETSHDPPGNGGDDVAEINTPDKLSLEATMINQNFSQQVIRAGAEDGVQKTFDEANPFYEEPEAGAPAATTPASIAYRYRKFTMHHGMKVVVRCELHSWVPKKTALANGGYRTETSPAHINVSEAKNTHFCNSYSFNEWDSRYSGGINWRQKVDGQRGAVLATEVKNNSCKVGKWTAQSILSGVELMKIGYVSRTAPSNAAEHLIVAAQSFKPKDLAQQIALSVTNMWGIVKTIVDLVMQQEDGKYVLLKDPNKPAIRLFSVPPNTFEDSDEEVDDMSDLDEKEEKENQGEESD